MDIIYRQFDSTMDKEDFISFFEANDHLFPDPFSNHVSIRDYTEKLICFADICVAIADGKIVGMSCAYMNDAENRIVHLQALLVDKEFQGHHIGKTLCSLTIDRAREAGMESIVLTVEDSNKKAQSLYSSIGYVFYTDETDIRPHKLHMVYDLVHQTKRVQNRLLEMGETITRILDAHQIPHFIAFGTLLGAVRHKGFIPWDDDFDLFLFDDTYDTALSCLRSELPPDMFLEYFDSEPLYFHAWAHVKDMNSRTRCEQFPQDNLYQHKGVSIDLYRLRKMDINEVDRYRTKEHIAYLERKYKVGLIDEATLNRSVAALEQQTEEKAVPPQEVYGMALNERFVTCDEVFPLKRYAFEDAQFWGPNDYDSMLKRFYGDYMQLPAEADRIPHYSSVKFFK